MKIDLIPIKKFIIVNNLKEVTDPILFEKGAIPSPNGLLSNEIFGSTLEERKRNFAFIRLNGHFLDPLIYKLLKRTDNRFVSIVHGTKNFIINESGELIEDEEKGKTGLEFLYKNWEKINFKKNSSKIRAERIDVLNAFDKDTLFCEFWIVQPAFYRDVNLESKENGKMSHHEINDLYSKLIRLASVLNDSNNFDFIMNNTRSKIQDTLVDIYNLCKTKLEKKHGLIRKSLLSKNIDYGSRSVIATYNFDSETPEEMLVDFFHSGIPLEQVCSTFLPFITAWLKRFFQREIESMGAKYPVRLKDGKMIYVNIENPELYFNEDYIKKKIDRFVFSPTHRFDKIELPVKDERVKGEVYLTFTGRFITDKEPELESPISKRPATWCDVLYQAAVDVTSDKMTWITRYPILDYFGTLTTEIRVLSTRKTVPMFVGNKVYKNYPSIDINLPKEKISTEFIDTIMLSNLYLAGLVGDYDGDQVTNRSVFTQEANLESKEIMKRKSNLLNIEGKNMRRTTNEAVQAIYTLTCFEN